MFKIKTNILVFGVLMILTVLLISMGMAADEKPKTDVNGVLFADYKFDLSEKTPAASNLFEITRVYLTASQKITDNSSIKVVIETTPFAIFLKNAFVEFSGWDMKLRVGSIGTPWIGYEEGIWRHRFVQKTFSDNEKYLSSADLGLGLNGNLLNKLINYDFVLVNGEGYNSAEISSDKAYGLRVSVEPLKGAKVHLYEQLNRTLMTGNPVIVDRNRTVLGASFESEKFAAMASYLIAIDSTTNIGGLSIHSSYTLFDYTTIFARYDFNDPNQSKTDDAYSRVILGVNQGISKNINLALDVQLKLLEKETITVKNETILFTHLIVKY